jgi:CBS domain-containing protein
MMDHERGKRLPVVDEQGRLVGIVSRRDLLRVYLRDDAAIRDEIHEEILRRTLWIDPETITVVVDRGTVTLAGTADWRSTTQIAARLCESVGGVVEVDDQMAYDSTTRPTCTATTSWGPACGRRHHSALSAHRPRVDSTEIAWIRRGVIPCGCLRDLSRFILDGPVLPVVVIESVVHTPPPDRLDDMAPRPELGALLATMDGGTLRIRQGVGGAGNTSRRFDDVPVRRSVVHLRAPQPPAGGATTRVLSGSGKA